MTKLQVDDINLEDSQLSQITEVIPNVIEASFILYQIVKVDTIIAMLEKNTKLLTLHLQNIENSSSTLGQELQARVSKKWRVTLRYYNTHIDIKRVEN